jgi:uncharacterized protein (TIGR00369 family)
MTANVGRDPRPAAGAPAGSSKIRKLTASQTRKLLATSSFVRMLGGRLAQVHRDGVTLECPVHEGVRNVYGALHGGVPAAMADTAAGIALQRHFGGSQPMTTVEFKINYFLPVHEGTLFARARLIRVGSSICVANVELSDSAHRAVGTALVTYMLLGFRAGQRNEGGASKLTKRNETNGRRTPVPQGRGRK